MCWLSLKKNEKHYDDRLPQPLKRKDGTYEWRDPHTGKIIDGPQAARPVRTQAAGAAGDAAIQRHPGSRRQDANVESTHRRRRHRSHPSHSRRLEQNRDVTDEDPLRQEKTKDKHDEQERPQGTRRRRRRRRTGRGRNYMAGGNSDLDIERDERAAVERNDKPAIRRVYPPAEEEEEEEEFGPEEVQDADEEEEEKEQRSGDAQGEKEARKEEAAVVPGIW